MSDSRTTESYVVITYHQWEVERTKHKRRTRAKTQKVKIRMLGVTRSYIASVSWFNLVRFRVINSLLHNFVIWCVHLGQKPKQLMEIEVNDCDGWLFFNVRAGQLEHKLNPTGMSYSRTTDSYIIITYHQWEVETTKHKRRTRAKNQEVNPRMLGVTRSYIASVSWFNLVRFRVIHSLLHLHSKFQGVKLTPVGGLI